LTAPDAGAVTLAAGGALTLLVAGLILQALIRAGHDWVDAVAGLGMAAITALGWVLSYISLRDLALAHGEPAWAEALWPATIDLFALVAGVKAIRARAEARPDRYAEGLALLYSAGAIAGNVVMARGDALGMVIHGVPAATMVLGWHLLLRGVRRPGSRVDAADTAAGERGAATGALRPLRPALAPDVARHGREDEDSADVSADMSAMAAPVRPMAAGESRRSMPAADARRVVADLVRGARAAGWTPTTDEVTAATGRGPRQAWRLLNRALAEHEAVKAARPRRDAA
jgi:hypothetical protein